MIYCTSARSGLTVGNEGVIVLHVLRLGLIRLTHKTHILVYFERVTACKQRTHVQEYVDKHAEAHKTPDKNTHSHMYKQ